MAKLKEILLGLFNKSVNSELEVEVKKEDVKSEEIKIEDTLETEEIEETTKSEAEFVSEEVVQNETVEQEEILSDKRQEEISSDEPVVSEGEYTLPSTQWFAQYEIVAGLSHRKSTIPLPCQDSAFAFTAPKPTIIIADGAGSSAVSDLGSKAVVMGLARFIKTMGNYFSDLLDNESSQTKQREAALILVKHAKGILEDLATEHRRPLKDFRCTLLLAIIGKVHTLWVKVGDGALVIERQRINDQKEMITELSTLGEVGKGEYANATTFIDEHLQPDDVQSDVLVSKYITALFAMSDGGAEKFVSTQGDRVAMRLSHWADLLRQERLLRYQLTRAFYADDFVNGHTGDDCSIAMVSAKL